VTRTQHLVLGVLSIAATAVVLMQGASGGDLAISAALHKPVTVTAALPGGAVSADAAVAGDDDAVADDVAPADAEAAVGDAAETDAAGDTPADTTSGPGTTTGDSAPTTDEPTPSKIEHVFVIALAGHGFEATFGPTSAAPYLARELVPQGTLLTNYHSLGRADLPDYLAMIGGQPPNDDTRAGCPTFKEIPPTSAPSKSGEIAAAGCVFPNTVTTLGDQLTASRRDWRVYAEDMEKGPKGRVACRRPESNGPDDTARARPGDGYATRHNPFVYYHSLLDLGDCDAKVGPLDELEADLRSAEDTPDFGFVAPNLCHDGSESPCADGSPGGLAAADAFLATWVPRILAAPGFEQDGLLIVTFAGSVAPTAAAHPDAGVRNGTLLLSRFAEPGTTAGADYDPYSLLRSIQDLFALRPLARSAKARSFADTVLADALSTPPSDG
jgi:phosphatidylinositol-3-phosphatase